MTAPTRTITIADGNQPPTASPRAVPAARECWVTENTIIRMLRPTDSTAKTSTRKWVQWPVRCGQGKRRVERTPYRRPPRLGARPARSKDSLPHAVDRPIAQRYGVHSPLSQPRCSPCAATHRAPFAHQPAPGEGHPPTQDRTAPPRHSATAMYKSRACRSTHRGTSRTAP